MKVCCSDLMALPSFRQIRLVGGAEGLNRIVRWPYVTLTNTIDQWVHGGEFMFVSGIGIEDVEESLLGLVAQSDEKKLSGVVILIGPDYIKSIPQSAIELANQLSLPLFEMPFSVPLVEPTEEISSFIVKCRLEEQFVFEALTKIFSGDCGDENSLVSQAAFYRYGLSGPHRAAALRVTASDPLDAADVDFMLSCQKSAEAAFKLHGYNILSMVEFEKVIFLLPAGSVEEEAALADILREVQNTVAGGRGQPCVTVGLGRVYHSLCDMAKSKSEAEKALKVAQGDGALCHFEELGIFRVLFELNDHSEMARYCEEMLGELEAFDRNSDTHYMETLETYLDEDCNAIKAASRLFLHRNSLNYRIKKIESITGCDLSDFKTRLHFRDAFLIKKFLRIAN